jgi:hypothetical protein
MTKLGLLVPGLGSKNAKLLSRKKNRVSLTPRDLLKPATIVADIFVDFVRCIGADYRSGCVAAGRVRSSEQLLSSDTAGAVPAKSFNGARFHQRQRGMAHDR